LKLQPLYVAKKQLWVNSKKRTDEEGSSSSDSESSTSRQSATSRRSGEKKIEAGGDWPRGVRPTFTSQKPPQGYGASSMRIRTKNDHEAGIQITTNLDEEDGMATGGDDDGVRVVTARSWLEGSEVGRSGRGRRSRGHG